MGCEQWRGSLDRYLDGELPPVEAAALSAHLRGCPGCAADVLERVQIKRVVHSAGKRYEPSAELRNKITKSIGARSRSGIAWQWRSVLVPALVLVVAALLLSSYLG